MSNQPFDPELFTTPFAFTPTSHRNPYPAISPTLPRNAQTGKLVLIVGAGSGIGAATAHVFARAGAAGIVLAGRRLDRLEATAKTLDLKDVNAKVLPVVADVTDDKAVGRLFERVKGEYGRAPDVVIYSAALQQPLRTLMGVAGADEWFARFEVNVKGLYAVAHHWFRSQADPAKPTGTLVFVSGGGEALVRPELSDSSVSKLAAHRTMEYLHLEYPTLRSFIILPGLVATDAAADSFLKPWSLDHEDLTGMVSLWLLQQKADFMRGRIMCVNWDVEELEKHSKMIEEQTLLKLSWVSALPVSGGKRLEV